VRERGTDYTKTCVLAEIYPRDERSLFSRKSSMWVRFWWVNRNFTGKEHTWYKVCVSTEVWKAWRNRKLKNIIWITLAHKKFLCFLILIYSAALYEISNRYFKLLHLLSFLFALKSSLRYIAPQPVARKVKHSRFILFQLI
jgi:hypothetical protein